MIRPITILSSLVYWGLRHPFRAVLVGLLALVVLSFLLLAWIDFQGRRELAAVIAETDREWPRWRLKHVLADRPQITTDKDGTVRLRAIMQNVVRNNQLDDLHYELVNSHSDFNRLLPASFLQAIELQTESVHELTMKLIELKDYPQGCWMEDPAPDWISTVDVSFNKYVSYAHVVLSVETINANRPGKDHEFLHRLQSLTNAINFSKQQVNLTSQLMRLSLIEEVIDHIERRVATHELTSQAISELETIIQQLAEPVDIGGWINIERAGMNQLFEHVRQNGIFYDNEFLSEHPHDSLTLFTTSVYVHTFLADDQAYYLRYANNAMRKAQAPSHDLDQVLDDPFEQIETDVANSWFQLRLPVARLFAAKFGSLAVRANEFVARVRCAAIGLAAEQFRLKHARLPHDLSELVASGFVGSTIDPFTGTSLQSNRDETGVTFYSLGRDRVDDQGKRRGNEGQGDIDFRLWNPDQRGLPPLPDTSPPNEAN